MISRFNHLLLIVWGTGVWVDWAHCMSDQGCWQENNVCFHPSSPRAEIRLHSEEWARSALRSLFFSPQHNFPSVNWSVFASLSTPAKQHLPWSYRISIRSFPNVALSQLQCFCSYMVASLWSLLSDHTVCRCFGETCLAFLWRSFYNSPPCFMLFCSEHLQELTLHMLTHHHDDAQSNSEPCFEK